MTHTAGRRIKLQSGIHEEMRKLMTGADRCWCHWFVSVNPTWRALHVYPRHELSLFLSPSLFIMWQGANLMLHETVGHFLYGERKWFLRQSVLFRSLFLWLFTRPVFCFQTAGHVRGAKTCFNHPWFGGPASVLLYIGHDVFSTPTESLANTCGHPFATACTGPNHV